MKLIKFQMYDINFQMYDVNFQMYGIAYITQCKVVVKVITIKALCSNIDAQVTGFSEII